MDPVFAATFATVNVQDGPRGRLQVGDVKVVDAEGAGAFGCFAVGHDGVIAD